MKHAFYKMWCAYVSIFHEEYIHTLQAYAHKKYTYPILKKIRSPYLGVKQSKENRYILLMISSVDKRKQDKEVKSKRTTLKKLLPALNKTSDSEGILCFHGLKVVGWICQP